MIYPINKRKLNSLQLLPGIILQEKSSVFTCFICFGFFLIWPRYFFLHPARINPKPMITETTLFSLENAPLALSRKKIVYDANGKGCDAIFMEVNPAFEEFCGLSRRQLLGKMQSEVFPGDDYAGFRLFEKYGEIAKNQGSLEHELYDSRLKKWIKIKAFSDQPGFISILYLDITQQKEALLKLVNISEVFLQLEDQPINYQQITDLMQDLSGARYVVLNLYDPSRDYFTTTAISGSWQHIRRASSIFGFNIIGSQWPKDPFREALIGKQNITVFSGLQQLAANALSAPVIFALEKFFKLGQVVVARITRGQRLIGDFTFLMGKGVSFRNPNEVEMFSRQVGIVLMQRQAEAALRENENKYRGIFESMQDVYFETDLKGTILELSPSIELLSEGQYNRESLLGNYLQDFYRENQERIRLVKILRTQREVYDYEICLRNRDGSLVKCAISARMVFHKDGSFEKITGIMRNISQRIAAEKALKASEERFRKLSEASAAAVMISKGKKFHFVNQAAVRISGYSEQELMQMDMLDLVHPDHFSLLIERLEKREQALPLSNRFEIKILHKSGEERWIDVTSESTRLDEDMAVVATAFDITERKHAEEALRKSEERFRSLTDNAFEGIYLIQDHKYHYVNDRFCEITGHPREELLREDFNYETLLTPKSAENLRQRYRDRKNGKEVSKTYELEVITPQGKLKYVEVSTVKIEQGEQPFYIGIMRDITERKINENLRQKVILAQQAASFKQNFLANMSHEMRTPMNGIIGMTSIMSKTRLSPEQRNYLKVIEESSKSLLNLINDVLHLSKIEAGKVQLKKNNIQTDKFLEKIRILYLQAAKAKGLTLTCSAEPDFPEFFICDENRLMQVINNLVSNAIKFTQQGFVQLHCQLLENYHDNLTLQITVSDSGVGIPPEHQQFVFEEFSQVDNSSTRIQEGTGLGLAISKRITEMLGGTIQVESTPRQGSTFSFTFKAQKAFQGLDQASDKPLCPQNGQKLNLSVLVVEDKLVNRLVAELMLKDLGCRVEMAENGLIAIEKIIRKKYDAVLMDIQMPVMDGVTAVGELRKLKIKLPVIIGLSAEAMEGDAERYIASGMDDYLTKPLDQNLLLQKIREHCPV